MKMTLKQYTPSTKTIEILKGKLNFFDTPKTFAETINIFANSKNLIAKIDEEAKNMIKARKTLIQEHEKALEDTPNDPKHIEEITKLLTEIETISDRNKELKKKYDSEKYTFTEIDENMWYAYVEYIKDNISKKEYMQTIAMWFNQYGAKAHEDTINHIIQEVANKTDSNNSTLRKSNYKDYRVAKTYPTYMKNFYHEVADMMSKVGTLKPFDASKMYYTAKDESKKVETK